MGDSLRQAACSSDVSPREGEAQASGPSGIVPPGQSPRAQGTLRALGLYLVSGKGQLWPAPLFLFLGEGNTKDGLGPYSPCLLCLCRAALAFPALSFSVPPGLMDGTELSTGCSERGGVRHPLASWEDVKTRWPWKVRPLPPAVPFGGPRVPPDCSEFTATQTTGLPVAGEKGHTLQLYGA